MIHTITGLMNSGKTLFMTKKLLYDYLKGRTIYTNYYVNFPHKEINRDVIIQWSKEQPLLENVSIGLDEVWAWFDSRSSQENKDATTFFLQSSKGDCNIYLTTQTNSQNDKRIRENQHFITICERRILASNKFRSVTDEIRILPQNLQNNLYIKWITYKFKLVEGNKQPILKAKGYLYAKPLFALFNTNQKITK